MKDISVTLIRTLREQTGIGIMDCKRALLESDGDLEKAIDWLRKAGLSKVLKKANRLTSEGLIGVALSHDQKQAVAVEVNSETDFVARNEIFKEFTTRVSELSLSIESMQDLMSCIYCDSDTVQDVLHRNISSLGENQTIRRIKKIHANSGICTAYVHACVAPYLGRIASIVALDSDCNIDLLQDLGKKIAMHIAASKPQFLCIKDIDHVALERERAILFEKAKISGKPHSVIEKMIDGGMRKFYQEVVLLEQECVLAPGKSIKEVISMFESQNQCKVKLVDFVLFVLGDGIEKQQEDFALEVSKAAGVL